MITITARSLMPLLVMMLSVTSVTVAHAKSRCVVADPSGTPLNVRTTPDGKIVSTLPNGQFVTIIDNSSDRSGKQWAYVSDYETSQPLGWVFRKFITCGATPLPTPPATSHQPAPTESYTGTGFMVSSDGFVLTNRHVVEKCETVTIHDRGQATVREVDETNDLALLKMEGSTLAGTFRTTSPSLGDSIFALGFPYRSVLGAGINFTGGLISSLSGVGNDSRYLQFTAPVQPGNSGGPLVDGDGLIVGVVSARLPDMEMLKASGTLPQNVNFAIRGDLAMDFLGANGVQPLVAEPKSPLSAEEIATKAQAYTVQVICQPDR